MPNYPDRCQHIKVNGTQCGSPALRRNKFCYFHKRFRGQRITVNRARADRRCATFDLPVLEDANSIQVAIMETLRLLALGHIDSKSAGLYLYALQTASSNLGRTRLDPLIHDVILDPSTVDQNVLNSRIWVDQDFEEEDDDEEEDEENGEEQVTLTEQEKGAILQLRELRSKEERQRLAWAKDDFERDQIRREFSTTAPATAGRTQVLTTSLSKIVNPPTPKPLETQNESPKQRDAHSIPPTAGSKRRDGRPTAP